MHVFQLAMLGDNESIEWNDLRRDQDIINVTKHLGNHEVGYTLSTTPRRRCRNSQSLYTIMEEEMPSTPCKTNEESREHDTYNVSFSLERSEDSDQQNPFLVTTKTPTSKPAEIHELAKNTAERRKQEKASTSRIFKRARREIWDREAEQTLVKRAQKYCRELESEMWRESTPPHTSNIIEDLKTCISKYSHEGISKLLCYGCMANLAVESHDLRECYRSSMMRMLGVVMKGQGAPNGGMDMRTEWLYGTK